MTELTIYFTQCVQLYVMLDNISVCHMLNDMLLLLFFVCALLLLRLECCNSACCFNKFDMLSLDFKCFGLPVPNHMIMKFNKLQTLK